MGVINTYPIAAAVILAILGMLLHVFKQMSQAKRDSGAAFSFRSYWLENWIQSVMSVIAVAIILGLDLIGTGGIDPLAALAVGMAGNSAVELIGSRTVGGAKV